MSACPDKVDAADDDMGDDKDDSVECRVNNFGNVLFDELPSLWERKLFCDVTFEVNSRRYKCHRIVLASISNYFKCIFRQTGRHVIRIRNIKNNIFEDILKFAYTGNIKTTHSNVFELVFACSFLEIPLLAAICVEFAAWHIDAENCFDVITFANAIGVETLREKAINFITRNQDKLFIREEICMNSFVSVLDFFNDRTRQITRNGVPISSSRRETYFINVLKTFVTRCNTNETFAELIKFVNLPSLPASKWTSNLQSHKQLLEDALVDYILELSDMHRQGNSHEYMPSLWDTAPRENWNFSEDRPTKHNQVTEAQCPKVKNFNDKWLTDPSVLVSQIELYFRPWFYTAEKQTDVLGGMKLIYDDGLVICHGLDPKTSRNKRNLKTHVVKLKLGELINAIELTFGWCINKIAFHTSEGRQLGPFGGVGGDLHIYKMPTLGQFGHFHCFSGNEVMTYNMLAITCLQITWAYFSQDNQAERCGKDSENHQTALQETK
ncbi:kelch-like protein 24 [Argopecten irradians]|uniref:kelch-like protein 24 n=1 Tax=Argopecten irradians TaxID=31199 RepID=UPI00371990F0